MNPTFSSLWMAMAAVIGLGFAGCGSDFALAPVSGVVTAGGEPVAGVEVVFYPRPTDDKPAPGPFAVGTTDQSGNFTLRTRHGSEGAVVGINDIGFEMPGVSRTAMEAAENALGEMHPKRDADGIAIVKQRIAKMKEREKQFSKIDPSFLNSRSLQVTVPQGGLDGYEIDLSLKK